jgi:hypothetical protein
MQQSFNYDAAARFAQINYAIALGVTNAPQRPAWKQGDFFGDTSSAGTHTWRDSNLAAQPEEAT